MITGRAEGEAARVVACPAPGAAIGARARAANLPPPSSVGGLRRGRSDAGGMHYVPPTEAEFVKEWGLTPEAERRLIAEFRDRLKAAGLLVPGSDDAKLRRFLRARQHEMDRAAAMWKDHVAFRREFSCDTLLQDFHFAERDAFISLYPQGYHKVDRLVREGGGGVGVREREEERVAARRAQTPSLPSPLAGPPGLHPAPGLHRHEEAARVHDRGPHDQVSRAGGWRGAAREGAGGGPPSRARTQTRAPRRSSPPHPAPIHQEYERLCRYIMPACSKVAGRPIESTLAILDLKGVGFRHLTGDVKRIMMRIIQIDGDNYPEMMGHTCIVNAPPVFKAFWAAIRPMLDGRTQSKIEVCPTKFAPALLRWVAPEDLPEYLGGTSKATLLDDAGPWQDARLVAEIDAEAGRVAGAAAIAEEEGAEADASRHVRVSEPDAGATARLLPPPPQVPADDDGYATPRSESSYASAASRGASVAAAGGVGAASLLARVAALEDRLPPAFRAARLRLAGEAAAAGGRGTLLMRVEALELAVDAALATQARPRGSRWCCGLL